jgi:hypothetical protein
VNEAHDRKLLEVMDTVARGEMPKGTDHDREVRETVEALGLLPYALEPAIRTLPLPALPPREEVVASPPPVLRPEFGASPKPSRWLHAAAAVLALALIGASAFFSRALHERELQIAHLEGQLSVAGVQGSELATARTEIGELQRHLRLVTHTSVGICPLRPTAETPRADKVRGMLYAADSDGWYLIAEGLEPAPADHAYTVWFLLEDGPHKAGILEVPESGRAELMAEGFPDGSRGIMVTLEGEPGVAEPEGPEMLFGDAAEMIRL